MKAAENAGDILPEVNGIGLKNESSLHSDIKNWYLQPNDRLESKVDGYVVDIVRDGLLIEIQTKHLYAISRKIKKLAASHKIKLVHPIAAEKWITKLSYPEEQVVSRRKSPKKGKLLDVFNELMRVPELINEENVTLEVIMIKLEELWCPDGAGSWRRSGMSIRDKVMLEVVDTVTFTGKTDFYRFIPGSLAEPFTNKSFAEAHGIKAPKASKITYTLRRMGIIKEVGRLKNAILYETVKY